MRVLMRRPLGGLWLDLEAPARSVQVTRSLSEPGDISVTLPIEYRTRRAEDGQPVLLEWGTLLVVEDDENRLAVGLVDGISATDTEVTVTAGGLSMQSLGVPWGFPTEHLVEADPVAVFRRVWALIGGYDDAVPLRITGDTSAPGAVGTPESRIYRESRERVEAQQKVLATWQGRQKAAEATVKDKAAALFKAAKLKTVGQVVVSASAPSEKRNTIFIETDEKDRAQTWQYIPSHVKDGKKVAGTSAWVVVTGVKPQVDAYLAALPPRDEANRMVKDATAYLKILTDRLNNLSGSAAQPYTLSWHETLDLSKTIEELATAGPFEWTEWAQWSGDELAHGLRVGAPRLGQRRLDHSAPRFELGVNVHAQPTLTVPDFYTELRVYGDGQGSGTLREQRNRDAPGRVRRVLTVTDKDLRTRARVARRADQELATIQRAPTLAVDQITVLDHPHAPRGSYDLGDEVLLTGALADGSDLDLWVRITSITDKDDEPRQLEVQTP